MVRVKPDGTSFPLESGLDLRSDRPQKFTCLIIISKTSRLKFSTAKLRKKYFSNGIPATWRYNSTAIPTQGHW